MFCEQSCACDRSCRALFPGCSCSPATGCQDSACLCVLAWRECDPDVCKNGHENDCVFCDNMNLQRQCGTEPGRSGTRAAAERPPHATVVRPSRVSGWGTFATRALDKDDFIGEYLGEVLTHDEAERRGFVYDRERVSFIFNLSDTLVVDATRIGNETRCINHSSKLHGGDFINCFTKVIAVRGQRRIAIFAKRHVDLRAGAGGGD
jgi:hypothetical protein